ncbi:unnamed protein product [Vitrella brassicaformis CCMP3155]|uniref:WHIM2 domain-containing protein n=5 Tax=Vitrella brassicaformis TaxID=1169539 RepID=A0A0G4EH73_VITBC|nr:unnamed protein product [Vitrella brassicaformis CCMP3155]|eukprot:CEL94724.1 unnamed protein product [Vitrella brassicaformis CCMP3155]
MSRQGSVPPVTRRSAAAAKSAEAAGDDHFKDGEGLARKPRQLRQRRERPSRPPSSDDAVAAADSSNAQHRSDGVTTRSQRAAASNRQADGESGRRRSTRVRQRAAAAADGDMHDDSEGGRDECAEEMVVDDGEKEAGASDNHTDNPKDGDSSEMGRGVSHVGQRKPSGGDSTPSARDDKQHASSKRRQEAKATSAMLPPQGEPAVAKSSRMLEVHKEITTSMLRESIQEPGGQAAGASSGAEANSKKSERGGERAAAAAAAQSGEKGQQMGLMERADLSRQLVELRNRSATMQHETDFLIQSKDRMRKLLAQEEDIVAASQGSDKEREGEMKTHLSQMYRARPLYHPPGALAAAAAASAGGRHDSPVAAAARKKKLPSPGPSDSDIRAQQQAATAKRRKQQQQVAPMPPLPTLPNRFLFSRDIRMPQHNRSAEEDKSRGPGGKRESVANMMGGIRFIAGGMPIAPPTAARDRHPLRIVRPQGGVRPGPFATATGASIRCVHIDLEKDQEMEMDDEDDTESVDPPPLDKRLPLWDEAEMRQRRVAMSMLVGDWACSHPPPGRTESDPQSSDDDSEADREAGGLPAGFKPPFPLLDGSVVREGGGHGDEREGEREREGEGGADEGAASGGGGGDAGGDDSEMHQWLEGVAKPLEYPPAETIRTPAKLVPSLLTCWDWCCTASDLLELPVLSLEEFEAAIFEEDSPYVHALSMLLLRMIAIDWTGEGASYFNVKPLNYLCWVSHAREHVSEHLKHRRNLLTEDEQGGLQRLVDELASGDYTQISPEVRIELLALLVDHATETAVFRTYTEMCQIRLDHLKAEAARHRDRLIANQKDIRHIRAFILCRLPKDQHERVRQLHAAAQDRYKAALKAHRRRTDPFTPASPTEGDTRDHKMAGGDEHPQQMMNGACGAEADADGEGDGIIAEDACATSAATQNHHHHHEQQHDGRQSKNGAPVGAVKDEARGGPGGAGEAGAEVGGGMASDQPPRPEDFEPTLDELVGDMQLDPLMVDKKRAHERLLEERSKLLTMLKTWDSQLPRLHGSMGQRTDPLGRDRDGNMYWHLRSDSNWLFVEQATAIPTTHKNTPAICHSGFPLPAGHVLPARLLCQRYLAEADKTHTQQDDDPQPSSQQPEPSPLELNGVEPDAPVPAPASPAPPIEPSAAAGSPPSPAHPSAHSGRHGRNPRSHSPGLKRSAGSSRRHQHHAKIERKRSQQSLGGRPGHTAAPPRSDSAALRERTTKWLLYKDGKSIAGVVGTLSDSIPEERRLKRRLRRGMTQPSICRMSPHKTPAWCVRNFPSRARQQYLRLNRILTNVTPTSSQAAGSGDAEVLECPVCGDIWFSHQYHCPRSHVTVDREAAEAHEAEWGAKGGGGGGVPEVSLVLWRLKQELLLIEKVATKHPIRGPLWPEMRDRWLRKVKHAQSLRNVTVAAADDDDTMDDGQGQAHGEADDHDHSHTVDPSPVLQDDSDARDKDNIDAEEDHHGSMDVDEVHEDDKADEDEAVVVDIVKTTEGRSRRRAAPPPGAFREMNAPSAASMLVVSGNSMSTRRSRHQDHSADDVWEDAGPPLELKPTTSGSGSGKTANRPRGRAKGTFSLDVDAGVSVGLVECAWVLMHHLDLTPASVAAWYSKPTYSEWASIKTTGKFAYQLYVLDRALLYVGVPGKPSMPSYAPDNNFTPSFFGEFEPSTIPRWCTDARSLLSLLPTLSNPWIGREGYEKLGVGKSAGNALKIWGTERGIRESGLGDRTSTPAPAKPIHKRPHVVPPMPLINRSTSQPLINPLPSPSRPAIDIGMPLSMRGARGPAQRRREEPSASSASSAARARERGGIHRHHSMPLMPPMVHLPPPPHWRPPPAHYPYHTPHPGTAFYPQPYRLT